MRKYIFLLFLSYHAFAQYPILNDSIKKAGIYKTFDEFKNNSPSIALNYPITSKNNIFFTHWGKESITTYAVGMPKEDGRDLGSVYGFCDGNSFYIFPIDNMIFPNTVHKFVFYRMTALGKYPYLDIAIGNNYDAANGDGSFNLSKTPSIDLAVLYFETGEVKKLTVNRLKEILADKPQLLEKFKKQESKNDYLKVYLKEYLKN